MNVTEQDLRTKLDAARGMPFGRAQIAAVEEVVRHADALRVDDLRFAARMLGTSAYTFGGERVKAFVTFAWCLAAHDRDGSSQDDEYELLWQFKWMVNAMTDFPEIPLDHTYAVLDDMERRYRVTGQTMNPVHQYRQVVARHIGDRETAAEQYRLWCAAPRGDMSDCAGCEPTGKVRYLAWEGRDEDAVAAALPVLDGELNCIEQPQSILTSLLLPYLRSGRLDEAADAHRRAYRAIQANRAEMSMLATHLEFCALSGNHARGLDLVERHLGWLAEPPSPDADMRFAAAAALVLRLVTDTGHGDTPVHRPALGAEPATTLPAKALHDELAARAQALADRFDARNGTSEVGDLVTARMTATPVVEHLPLSGPVRRAARAAVRGQAPARPVDLPDSPTELVEVAREAAYLGDGDREAAVWRRFDELCPEPGPELLAPRLAARATELIRSDPAEAERLLTRTIELYEQLGDHPRATAQRGRLGVLWARTGRGDEGVAAAEASAAELAATGDARERTLARFRLGMAYEGVDRTDDAHETFTEALRLAEEHDQTVLAADAAFALAQLEPRRGQEHLPAALTLMKRVVPAYESVPGSTALPHARMFTARLHASLGEFDEARPLLIAAAETGDRTLRAMVRDLHGNVELDAGRPVEACDLLAAAVADLEAEGAPTMYVKLAFADASLRVGRPDEAADALEEALPALPPEDAEEVKRARFMLAKAYASLGWTDQALTLCAEVRDACLAEDNQAGAGQMHAMAGDLLDERDRDADAAAEYTRAAELFGAAGVHDEELTNRRKAALAWHWAQEPDRSRAELAAADELAGRLDGDDPRLVWQKAVLDYDAARILAAADRQPEALPRAEKAVAGFRTLGATDEVVPATTLRARLLADLDRVAEAEELLRALLTEIPVTDEDARERVTSFLESLGG